MKNIQLIALDMDGTLLNSNLEISNENRRAIHKAVQAGKDVVICSGRAVNEVEQYTETLPEVRYLIGESGTIVYDLKENRVIYRKLFPSVAIEQVLNLYNRLDCMLLVCVNGISTIQNKDLLNLEHFGLDCYFDLYNEHLRHVENMEDFVRSHTDKLEKMNLYFANVKDRDTALEVLRQYPLACSCTEEKNIENNAEGVNKAEGLRELCKALNITPKNCMMVGDGSNDIPVLEIAGVAVAVENAEDEVKKVCQYIVSSNDDNGVKEAIENIALFNQGE